MADHPVGELSSFIDLNGEQNLPAWYSSIQWFCVTALLGIFAVRNFRFSHPSSWLLLTLPPVFLLLSLDEIAQIHEWLGNKSDALLPGASRAGTPFFHTGIWMFLLGLPFLILFNMLVLSTRVYFRRAPGALMKLLLGMAIMLGGSIGIETLHNFVEPGSLFGTLQILFEELCEMVGATIILWGSYEILHSHGFTWTLDPVEQ